MAMEDSRYAAAIAALERDGFWYVQSFAAPKAGQAAVSLLAKKLGEVRPQIVLTAPAVDAPDVCPFDRGPPLGWHNDFCTHADRPRFSLAFVQRADPRGSPWGDWRVAKVVDVVRSLRKTERGQRAFELFRDGAKTFEFDGETFHFPVLCQADGEPTLRFYGAGLRAGAARVEASTELLDAIAAVEEAADTCAVELTATPGSLLIVDNCRTLHDRHRQSVDGAERRQVLLMFAG